MTSAAELVLKNSFCETTLRISEHEFATYGQDMPALPRSSETWSCMYHVTKSIVLDLSARVNS